GVLRSRNSAARSGADGAAAAALARSALTRSFFMVIGTGRAPDSSSARPVLQVESAGLLAPADLGAVGARDAGQPGDGLVGDELRSGVEEVQAVGDARLLAGLGEFHDGVDSERGHLRRVLL